MKRDLELGRVKRNKHPLEQAPQHGVRKRAGHESALFCVQHTSRGLDAGRGAEGRESCPCSPLRLVCMYGCLQRGGPLAVRIGVAREERSGTTWRLDRKPVLE